MWTSLSMYAAGQEEHQRLPAKWDIRSRISMIYINFFILSKLSVSGLNQQFSHGLSSVKALIIQREHNVFNV